VGSLTGVRGSELWIRVVLQAAEAESCIRHTAIAVGALDFKSPDDGDVDFDIARREFAYSEYHNAIVGLRRILILKDFAKDFAIGIELISYILLACFEAYYGNNEATLT
jgi:hypothetical protein